MSAGCQPARGRGSRAPVKDRSAGSSVFRTHRDGKRQTETKEMIDLWHRITRALCMSDLSFITVCKHWQKLQVIIEFSYCVEETGYQ